LSWLAVLVVALCAAAGGEARASDLFGSGARNVAMGGAASASCNDGTAAAYNPALLGAIDSASLSIWYSGVFPSVEAEVEDFGSLGHIPGYQVGDDSGVSPELSRGAVQSAFASATDLDPYSGFGVAFVLPSSALFPGIPIEFGIGGSIEVPGAGTSLAEFSSRSPTQPFFPTWNTPFGQSRILFGLGVEVWEDVAWLGASASIHSAASGEVVTLTPIATFDPKHPDENMPTPSSARTTQELSLSVSPVAGLLVRPAKWLRLAAAYKGEEETSIAMDVAASMELNLGSSVEIELPYVMSGSFAYRPHRFTVGAALEPLDELTLTLDATYGLWEDFPSHVQVLSFHVADSALDEDGAIFIDDLGTKFRVDSEPLPILSARNTITPALGAEYRLPFGLDVRTGYSYRPSPMESDQGHVNMLLDNSWHQLSAGVGMRVSGEADGPKTMVSLSGQGIFLVTRHNKVGAADESGASSAAGLVKTSGWMGGVGVELSREF